MIRRLALVTLAFLAATPATGQRWPDEQCVRNPNLAPCVQSQGDQLAATFGARRIDEHRDAGEEVVRVFYYHNEDLALIAFVRAPGHEPTAYVYFPRRAGQPAPAPMQAPISQAVWAEAMWRSTYADRGLAPAPPIPADGTEVCLHPWNYVFEASVPAAPGVGVRARVRRYSANACDDAPLIQFAADFRRLAISLFPACDALDDGLYGNPVQRFVLCPRLSGDRLAAAQVMNLADAFRSPRGADDHRDLQGLFNDEAAIDWNGRRHGAEDRDPAAFWQARIREDQVISFGIDAAEGRADGRVRLTGVLLRAQAGRNDGTYLQARFEQIWATTYSGVQVVSVTVGPWESRPN